MPVLSELNRLGEFGLIRQLTAPGKGLLGAGIIGAGDDCAVIPFSEFGEPNASGALLVTTDVLVEGRHFRRDFTSAEDLGWKTLAVSLSDIAAMGGKPTAAVITLQLPPDTSPSWLQEVYRGIYQLAENTGVSIVGGDTSSASELSIGFTVLGRIGSSPILRTGAQPGDDIWVSGEIGGAFLALQHFDGKLTLSPDRVLQLAPRLNRPEPRLALAQNLVGVTAMIDVSDGLIQDLGHIAEGSGVTVELDVARVPTPECAELSKLVLLSGGDDYELLFTAPPNLRSVLEQNLAITRIGQVLEKALPQAEKVELRIGVGKKVSAAKALRELGLVGGYNHF